METPLYSEKQAMRFRWPLAVLGVAIMLYGAMETWPTEPLGAMVMILLAAGFVFVFCAFTVFTVVVTPTELRFGFPIFRKRFQLAEVEIGEVERIGVLAGIGIHFWNRKWVYNGRFGQGVNIRHGRYRYLVGTGRPAELQNVLMQSVPRRATQV